MISNERLDEMIKGIKVYADMPYGISINEFSSKDIYSALQELKERRECELKPATKFIDNTFKEQQEVILGECLESTEALENWYKDDNGKSGKENFDHFCEELVDLQTACETMLVILGLNEQQRQEARRKVIQKNMKRGYYNE